MPLFTPILFTVQYTCSKLGILVDRYITLADLVVSFNVKKNGW